MSSLSKMTAMRKGTTMKANNNSPAIRFAGYADAWERRQLGEIAQVRTGYPFDSKDFADKGEFLVITNGNIQDDNPSVDNSQGNHIDVTDNRIISQYVLDIGDILVTMDGTVGRTAKVAHNQMILAQRVGRLTFYGNEEFLYQALTSGNFSETMTSLSHGGTIKHISLSEISNYDLLLPENEIEQKKVGLLFQRVDRLITLHQRKYEKLVNLKKAMLDKMFPKNGELVPEVRFGGFSGNWERRKLGECFSERIESMPEGELISVTINDGVKRFAELGRHNNSNDDKSKYKRVCIGDIAYNSMRMWQGASGYSPYEGIVSPAYTVLSPNEGIDSKCVSYIFKMPEMIHTFQLNSQGITSDNWNLKFPVLREIYIRIPKEVNEQKEIATLFNELDNLITLHLHKQIRLQNIKSAFLAKMFV